MVLHRQLMVLLVAALDQVNRAALVRQAQVHLVQAHPSPPMKRALRVLLVTRTERSTEILTLLKQLAM